MGRPRDEFVWDQVTKEGNDAWRCNHCGKKFKGGVARIKAHLGTEKGKGITLCNRGSVPPNEGVNNRIMAGSSNPLEVVDGMKSFEDGGYQEIMIAAYFDGSMNHQNDAGPSNIVEDLAQVEDVVGSGNSGFESEINKMQELVDDIGGGEDRVEEELQWLEYCSKKRKREADYWLEEVGDLRKRARKMIDSLREGGLTHLEEEIEVLKYELRKEANSHLLYGSVDNYFKKMRELLRDDNVFFIGVHGMGGVGKTWLVTHFRNQIKRKGAFNFENVFWVTVSQDFSIFKLQKCIAKRIGIKLDDDDDEVIERADILSSALEKKDRSVLILDDVWNYIDLQKVGIPLRTNGIKLILTSRLKYVFPQMDCPADNIIRMEPMKPSFHDSDDRKLFLLKLGCHGTPAILPCELEKIARSVAEKCDGLPLGISVMARTMKGVNDIHTWRRVLAKLENSATGEEMEEEVIKVLKLSYDHLMDKSIQNCFLQLALYDNTSAEKSIINLVDEGLIKAMGSLEETFDEGQAILAKLVGHSLLLQHEYGNYLWMHRLVRHMANHIVKGGYMVKCSKGLKTIPDMQEWLAHLEKVFLINNGIKEIPEGTSPRCPQLSTLNFSDNELRNIPDCFFNHMKALCVLDLSYNLALTSLPNSLSSLRSLKSLLLEGCKSLEYVPPLGELQELSRLVISDTSIGQVPEGLAMLVKLKWLDLSCNEKLTSVAWSMLSGLTNMQYLNLWPAYVTGEVENMQGMSMLEYFVGGFQVGKNLANFVENILDIDSAHKKYHIFMGIGCFEEKIGPEFSGEDRKYVEFRDCEAFDHLLPRDLHQLRITRNKQWSGGICDALSFRAPSSLRRIVVSECPKLERLVCLSGSCSFCKHLQNLQSLKLYRLEGLDVIWKENDEGICLPNLSHLEIRGCQRMERLLTPASLAKLPNLKTIYVHSCVKMKEIFAMRSSEDDNLDSTITLPNSFEKLTLAYLPELTTVCTGIIVSGSRPTVNFFDCFNLKQRSVRYKPSPSDSESDILMDIC